MSDIFISFARADVESAARLADGLKQNKLSVWWDAGLRKEDASRSKEAAERLRRAQIVVCLWSSAYMRSDERRVEARRAKADGRLAPLALRDFSWRACPDDLSDVGTAIPRLQFTGTFFAWLGRKLLERMAAANTSDTADYWIAREVEEDVAHIDFASKSIVDACRSPYRSLAGSPALARKVDEYFLLRPELAETFERYRQRLHKLKTYDEFDHVVPFPGHIKSAESEDAKTGAARVRLRLNDPTNWERRRLQAAHQEKASPSLRVISNPTFPMQRPVASEALQAKPRFSLKTVRDWVVVALTGRRAEAEPPAREVRRKEDQRADILLGSIEKAYCARTIADLDVSMAEGFEAIGIEYVGVGAIPPNGFRQLIERRPSDLRQARWLDVSGNTALDPDAADNFIATHNFRVENAFLTKITPLRASVCAFAETRGGAWSDPRQAAAIRLLSTYYVSFASILHNPLAAPDIELSPRQRECLQWAAIGKRDRQISEILDLDLETVVELVRSARLQLQAETREQAVKEAITRGLIAPPFC